MNNSHRLITALVATGALLIGSTISSSAVTQSPPRPTLQGLQDQVNNTYYTKTQVYAIVADAEADVPGADRAGHMQWIVPAAVPRTGQTTCSDSVGNSINCSGTGQDGDKLAGVALPRPRFVDNKNGTVTDKLTGLIWLKNANCSVMTLGPVDWQTALTNTNSLTNGQCGLTDNSTAGQWRLPNVKELQSLINFGFFGPALSNAAGTGQWAEGDAFSGVQSAYYWSSSSYVVNPAYVLVVALDGGFVNASVKGAMWYVWPVRDKYRKFQPRDN